MSCCTCTCTWLLTVSGSGSGKMKKLTNHVNEFGLSGSVAVCDRQKVLLSAGYNVDTGHSIINGESATMHGNHKALVKLWCCQSLKPLRCLLILVCVGQSKASPVLYGQS